MTIPDIQVLVNIVRFRTSPRLPVRALSASLNPSETRSYSLQDGTIQRNVSSVAACDSELFCSLRNTLPVPGIVPRRKQNPPEGDTHSL